MFLTIALSIYRSHPNFNAWPSSHISPIRNTSTSARV
jgi:hypothetical protein